MELLNNKTNHELLESLTAETAKATNELKCAQQDVNKAQSRLNFVLVLLNELKARK